VTGTNYDIQSNILMHLELVQGLRDSPPLGSKTSRDEVFFVMK